MTYKVITAVAVEPITLAEAKLHLRVDSTADDPLITALITAARETAEHYAGRALAAQTLEMALDEFPDDDGAITLDMPPVASVSSIIYTDANGAAQTLAAAKYALSTYGDSRTVAPTYGNNWPSTRDIPDAVRIQYVTGSAACPKAAVSAMLLIIGRLYEERGDASDIPAGAKALLDTVKVYG